MADTNPIEDKAELPEQAEEEITSEDKVDHDRLFKLLIGTFFKEFMELFFPKNYALIDPESIQEKDTEIFTNMASGEKHEADLLRLVTMKGQTTKVIVHIEAQSSVKDLNFGKRMYDYFKRLTINNEELVFPIVVFSFDQPYRAEPDTYIIEVLGKPINQFWFNVVQLNRLDWQEFVNKPNPIASAMMAKMKVAPEDRARVKLECLRMMFGLGLDDARNELITGFVGTYLKLDQQEEVMVEQEIAKIKSPDKQNLHLFWTQWHEQGYVEGRAEERKETLLGTTVQLLQRKLKLEELPETVSDNIRQLDSKQLEKLTLDLLDFDDMSQLEAWLQNNSKSGE
jgi:Domain of unknown function (DUF4351)